MITKPTVIILGAGASMPFGYPSGWDLVKEICQELEKRRDRYRQLRDLGYPDRDIEGFWTSLWHSGLGSIDEFLERRAEFMEIGKTAIAQVIIAKESEQRLFHDDPTNWYRLLRKAMNSQLEEFSQNTVSFITFNYDRSLEHFLFTALRNSFRRAEDKIATALSQVQILHLHGCLGSLPWQSASNPRPYGQPKNNEELAESGRLIRIVHEGAEHETRFSRALTIIQNAERLLFIGFGYNPLNVIRLNPGSWGQKAQILGTAYGLTDLERRGIEGRFGRALPTLPMQAHEFLRDGVILDA